MTTAAAANATTSQREPFAGTVSIVVLLRSCDMPVPRMRRAT